MPHYRRPTTKDWAVTAVVIVALALGSVLIVFAGMPRFGAPAAVLAIIAAMLAIVRWHACTTAYRCAACGKEFEISMLKDLTTPHMVTTKYLRCPACGDRTWALALKKAAPSGSGEPSASGKG